MDTVSKTSVLNAVKRRVEYGDLSKEEAVLLLESLNISYTDKIEFVAHLWNTGLGFGYDTYFFSNRIGNDSHVSLMEVMKQQGFTWRGGERVKVTVEKVSD